MDTGLYLDMDDFSAWPGIPETPSDNMVHDAVKSLWHPFQEFPFECPIDRAGYFAALLTATVRSLLPTAPGFLICSPTAGSGKTLLAAQCLARLSGCKGEVLSNVRDDEEARKRLISLTRICSPVIVFDNVSGTLQSDALCAFVTSERISDRVLGSSVILSGRTNSLVVITGNNPIIVGDLNRRLLRARINPACENPFLRTFGLDPVEYVEDQRLTMVQAALTILKVSILSGFKHSGGRLASFEMWSDFVRNAVIWVGQQGWLDVADPVASVKQNYSLDPETRRLDALLSVWQEHFGPAGGTVLEAIRRACGNGEDKEGDSDLFAVLNDVAGEGKNINSRRLGNWIERRERRIVTGRQFVRSGTRQRAIIWASELRELGEFSPPYTENWQDKI